MRKYLVLIIILMCSSCVTYSLGYTPSVDYDEKKVSVKEKKDLTFSVSSYSEMETEIFSKKKMIEKMKDKLNEAKLFRKVHYVELENKSNYHIHFSFKLTGSSKEDIRASGLIGGLSLTVIPTWVSANLDSDMILYKNKEVVFNSSSPEMIKEVTWLPFIVTLPFVNRLTTGAYVKRKVSRYFVNEIYENKLY